MLIAFFTQHNKVVKVSLHFCLELAWPKLLLSDPKHGIPGKLKKVLMSYLFNNLIS